MISELAAPNRSNASLGRSPAYQGPLISLAAGGFVCIRDERDGGEPLFDERRDPDVSSDRARDEAMRPVVAKMREHLDRVWATSDPGR